MIRFHSHAQERMEERNATEDEVKLTIEEGESFPAKFGPQVSGGIFLSVASGEASLTEQSR